MPCAAQTLVNLGGEPTVAANPIVLQPSHPTDLPDAPSSQLAARDVPTSWTSAGSPEPSSADDKEVTLKGLPLRFLKDEGHILRSPAHIKKQDLKWLLPVAGATAVTFATDTKVNRDVVSHDSNFNSASNTTSDVLRGIFIGVPVVLFGAGELRKDDRSRESGLLAGEAMLDAYVFSEGVKYVTLRERPNLQNARGHFYQSDAASDPSFVSGHSIVAWSSAAVLAGEYSKPWQQIGLYTLASGVSVTRVLGQNHFPSDVLLGSVSGWLIGHYVYRAHHKHR